MKFEPHFVRTRYNTGYSFTMKLMKSQNNRLLSIANTIHTSEISKYTHSTGHSLAAVAGKEAWKARQWRHVTCDVTWRFARYTLVQARVHVAPRSRFLPGKNLRPTASWTNTKTYRTKPPNLNTPESIAMFRLAGNPICCWQRWGNDFVITLS